MTRIETKDEDFIFIDGGEQDQESFCMFDWRDGGNELRVDSAGDGRMDRRSAKAVIKLLTAFVRDK